MKTRAFWGKRVLAGERGFALVAVLILSAVLSLLAASVLVYARSGAVMAERDEREMQAYYLARSGAEAVAAWMEKHLQEGHALIGRETTAETPLGEGGIAKIKVYYKDPSNPRQENGVVIESRGRVGGVERTVFLTMTESFTAARPVVDMAVFSLTTIALGGNATLTGPVGTNSVQPAAVTIGANAKIQGNLYVGPSGNPQEVVSLPPGKRPSEVIIPDGWAGVKNLDAVRSYPPAPFPSFPEDLPWKGSLTVNGNDAKTIEGDGHYQPISVGGNGRLTVRLTGGETRIRVGTLTVSGNNGIVLEGQGKLALYVDSGFSLGGNSKINVDPSNNRDGDPSALILYYRGT